MNKSASLLYSRWFCRWEKRWTGFPHLKVVDMLVTPKRACYGAVIAFSWYENKYATKYKCMLRYNVKSCALVRYFHLYLCQLHHLFAIECAWMPERWWRVSACVVSVRGFDDDVRTNVEPHSWGPLLSSQPPEWCCSLHPWKQPGSIGGWDPSRHANSRRCSARLHSSQPSWK